MHVDGVIAWFASRQHGCVSWAQLIEAGVGRRAIQRRIESGHLVRIHRGVYAVGHVALPPLSRESAALLAVGPHAYLSHRSAAHVWRILPREEGAAVDVSVTEGQPRHRKGIRVHRTTTTEANTVRTKDSLSLTSPDRTLIELRGHVSAATLERATAEALAQRLIEDVPDDVARVVGTDAKRTRSEAERKLLHIIRQAGLPEPETNARVAGYEVDAVWREQRVVVEVDGYAFHGHRLAFERDRAKQLALQAAGYTVHRVTWRQLQRPYALIATLAARLSGRSASRRASAA